MVVLSQTPVHLSIIGWTLQKPSQRQHKVRHVMKSDHFNPSTPKSDQIQISPELGSGGVKIVTKVGGKAGTREGREIH